MSAWPRQNASQPVQRDFPQTKVPRSLAHPFGLSLTHKPKEITRHTALLNLIRALGNSIPSVVPINMLKRLIPRVANTAVYLHRRISCLTAELISLIITDRHFIRH